VRPRVAQDTSRQGRYHNTRFRDLATELGVAVDRDPSIGWSLTTVPDTTAENYADEPAAPSPQRSSRPSGAAKASRSSGWSVGCPR